MNTCVGDVMSYIIGCGQRLIRCRHATVHKTRAPPRPPCTMRYMDNGLLARDVTHQLWCINHIPANSPGYPRILPDKEVKSLGTIDCRKFSCCRLVDHPVQPTCVITSYSKEWFPREKLLTNFTIHSEDETMRCVSPLFTAESS